MTYTKEEARAKIQNSSETFALESALALQAVHTGMNSVDLCQHIFRAHVFFQIK
jgi:uncharacterized MAPEG superfamily protein